MTDRLVLEGDFEYGVIYWEDGFDKIGGKDLVTAIANFLGDADEDINTWDENGSHRTVYKNVRITVERLEDV